MGASSFRRSSFWVSQLQRMLRRLLLNGGQRLPTQQRSLRAAPTLVVETLEGRSLMAAGVFYDSATTTIRIEGDSGHNTATVERLTQGTSNIYDDQLRVTLGTYPTALSKPSFLQSKTFNLWSPGGVLDPAQTVNRIEFRGLAGDDTFRNNSDIRSFAEGGSGNDRLYGGSVTDSLFGGGGLDTLYGNGGDDMLDGGVPDAMVYADNTGDDILYGGADNDTLHASDYGHNKLFGEGGNDWLYGWQGNDTLDGGAGNDALAGFSGNDRLIGGGDNDRYVFQAALGNEVDTVVELAAGGRDTLDFSALAAQHPVEVNLARDIGIASHAGRTINTGSAGQASSWEDVIGGAGNDSLYGNAVANVLIGGPGNDGLFGGGGNDTLWGNQGPSGGAVVAHGADRFLMQDGDLAPDYWAGHDAIVQFVNGAAQTMPLIGFGSVAFAAGNWTDGEIVRVDTALANLHRHVNNTRLLRMADSNAPIVLERIGAQLSGTGVIGGWNDTAGTISLTSASVGSDTELWRTIYHEFGHNWDEATENPFSDAFRQLSDWQLGKSGTPGYVASSATGDDWWFRSTAQFARSYGRWNPWEDYATTWETYFLNRFHSTTDGNQIVQDKHDNLDLLFSQLRSVI